MSPDVPAAKRLIVALDVDTVGEAMRLVDRLGESVSFYKVGWQLFMGTHFQVPAALAERGKKVFLDLKIEDIPATVERALRNVPKVAADFLEVMTLKGSSAPVEAVRESRPNGRPKLLMLTLLSSMGGEDLRDVYGDGAAIDTDAIALRRARRAIAAGCDGVVASGASVAKLRHVLGPEPLIVTPGIRPRGAPQNDQKRVLTPFEAIRDGADYLVVGRPIREAPDPASAAQAVIEEIDAGTAARPATPEHTPHR